MDRMEMVRRYMEDPNIHSIGYGRKVRGGVETGEMGVVFHVLKKIPLSDLDERLAVPARIVLEGSELVTDVVESPRAELIGCKDWVPGQKVIDGCPQSLSCYGQGILATEEQNFHRARVRPVVGGMSITEYSKNARSLGTIGCLVRDGEDGSIVGLTNAHVVMSCPVDPVQHTRSYVESNVDCPVVQPATYEPWDGTSSSLPANPLADRVGLVKRSSFFNYGLLHKSGGWTVYIDAALVHMDPGSIDSSSCLIRGFEGFGPLQFASSEEIDSLLAGGNEIYVSGRTTGAKGGSSCGIAVAENIYVMGIMVFNCDQPQFQTSVNFYDIVKIRYLDGSVGVVVPGDSGSVVIADFLGAKKIVGLVYAAGGQDYSDGYFCRIDRVASQMNISAWDGGNIKHGNPSDWEYLTRNVEVPDPNGVPLQDNDTIVVDGKRYWKVGSERIPD